MLPVVFGPPTIPDPEVATDGKVVTPSIVDVLDTEMLPLFPMSPFEAPALLVKVAGAPGEVLIKFVPLTMISNPSVLFAAKLEVNPKFMVVVSEAALGPLPKVEVIPPTVKLNVDVDGTVRELNVVGPKV